MTTKRRLVVREIEIFELKTLKVMRYRYSTNLFGLGTSQQEILRSSWTRIENDLVSIRMDIFTLTSYVPSTSPLLRTAAHQKWLSTKCSHSTSTSSPTQKLPTAHIHFHRVIVSINESENSILVIMLSWHIKFIHSPSQWSFYEPTKVLFCIPTEIYTALLCLDFLLCV